MIEIGLSFARAQAPDNRGRRRGHRLPSARLRPRAPSARYRPVLIAWIGVHIVGRDAADADLLHGLRANDAQCAQTRSPALRHVPNADHTPSAFDQGGLSPRRAPMAVLLLSGRCASAAARRRDAAGLAEPQSQEPVDRHRSFFAQQFRSQARIAALLDAAGITSRTYSDTVPDPTVASIEAALAFLQAGDHDSVIGLGGGSPMDTAKAVAVLAVHGGKMRDYKAPHLQDDAGLPIVAIPTTAGTGSEATRFTIITDESVDEKMLCAGLAYLPVAALVDYELTLSMPARLTADTGVDAITHAIEAYGSRRANPFTDSMALVAMRTLWDNIRPAYSNPGGRVAREKRMLGATQAGISFSNSSVALVHGMGRPIGAFFHLAHGLSNAMLLPAVTAFSAEAGIERYAECARNVRVAGERGSDAAAAQKLVDALFALNADLAVPGPQRLGIDAKRWQAVTPVMAEQAIASGSPANNPRVPSEAEIEAIYGTVWEASS